MKNPAIIGVEWSGVDERFNIMVKFINKLGRSGYKPNRIHDIIESLLLGYYRLVQKEQYGVRLNKPSEHGQNKRDIRKILGKNNWSNLPKGEQETVKLKM